MKILITGANGYIGKSLYNTLKDKYEIIAITRKELDLNNSSQVNDFFKDKYFDVVLHCAVKGGSRLQQDDWSIIDYNLQMYYNLLANKINFNKFIHFGSGAELYAKNGPYGFSKDVIRKSILTKNNFYNLRIFGVFDENELDTRFIKANIKRYINKEPIQIHQDKIMDFFHMQDLIKVVEYYINEKNLLKEFNCSYSEHVSLKEITNIINNLNNYKVDIITMNKDLAESYTNNQWFGLGLNFIGLEEGIKQMYNKLKNEC
jgi:nucleoside-diphosphate-sugar epimerase